MSQITIKTAALRTALDALLPAVPAKPSRDILKCIKFVAKQGSPDSLVLQATDLERFISYEIPCVVTENGKQETNYLVATEGTFAVPATIVGSYVKAIEDAQILLMLTPQNTLKLSNATSAASIGSGTSEFEVGAMEIDDFPEFPSLSTVKNWFDVDADVFKFGLERVLFAVADKGHPKWGALSAVSMELDQGKLALIGTDQHRASISTLKIGSGGPTKHSLLVSATALEIVAKVFNETIKLSLDSPNALVLKSGQLLMFIRLVNGQFPPVRNFVPKHPNKLTIEAKTFLKELRKVYLAADQFAAVRIALRKDRAVLTAKTREEKKTAKVEYAITNPGPDIDFTINCKYLMDVLKVGNTFDVSYNRNNQPLLFSTEGFEHVIVPQETR